jgi:hypothetical protein
VIFVQVHLIKPHQNLTETKQQVLHSEELLFPPTTVLNHQGAAKTDPSQNFTIRNEFSQSFFKISVILLVQHSLTTPDLVLALLNQQQPEARAP